MATRPLPVNVTDEWKAERVRLATDAINALIAFTAHEEHVAGMLTDAARFLGNIVNDPDWQPYTDDKDDKVAPFDEPALTEHRYAHAPKHSYMFYATVNGWLQSRRYESEPDIEIDRMVERGELPAEVLAEAEKHDQPF